MTAGGPADGTPESGNPVMPRLDAFEFECPVKTHYGARALEHLPFELRALDAAKPLVIGDTAASRDGRVAAVLKAFRNAEMLLGVVEDVPGHDPVAVVPQLAAIYRDKDCDAVVAVGQGGFIDTAKWLNLTVSTGEDDLTAFVEDTALPRRPKPLAVLPPAAADGFELSGHLRWGPTPLRSVQLMPRLLFIDARTVGHPDPVAMAETALVALTLALESFYQGDAKPMIGVYARTAARLAAGVLHQLAHRGDHDQRLALSTAHAAALAGCALGAAPCGMTSRLAAALVHGRATLSQATGILLSYVLEHSAVSGRMEAADLLGLVGGRDRYARTPEGQRGPAAFYFLRNLLNLLFQRTNGGIKRTLQELGLSAPELEEAAERFEPDGEGEDRSKAAAILVHAWQGRPFLELNGHR